MEVCPYSFFQWCGYFWGPWCDFLWQMSSQWRSQKNTSRIGVSWSHCLLSVFVLFLSQLIMTILSKGCKPDNPESQNTLKCSFANIQGPCSNFAECEAFLETNSPDSLFLCETDLDGSVDCGNFSMMGYIPLIRKDFITGCSQVMGNLGNLGFNGIYFLFMGSHGKPITS